jgi:signal transduction histidine kinase
MMDDLLDQAQLESGSITINASKFDPHSIAKGVTTVLNPLAARKGLELKTEVAPELKEKQVYGDLARIMQCVNNIVENAIKFTVKGSITVRVFQTDFLRWGISIRDTGPGMGPEELSRAFDPFWQADSTVTREHRGVGLGLSITKQLVEMMEGIIDIESRPGEGTSFRILLPMKSSSSILKEKLHESV